MGSLSAEKGLPTFNNASKSFSTSRTRSFFILILLFCSIFSFHTYIYNPFPHLRLSFTNQPRVNLRVDQCTQVEPLNPSPNEDLDPLEDVILSSAYRNKSVAYLSNAIKFPTVSRDEYHDVPGNDPRWDIFYEFENYLKATFPAVHATLELEKVNTHGLFYTWKGTDESLKPTLLMAHTDVVPVPENTIHTVSLVPISVCNCLVHLSRFGGCLTKLLS